MTSSPLRNRLLALAAGVALALSPVVASAGLMDSAVQLAKPLAEKFGVPSDLVSSLLDGGFDLETVVQSLLIDQAADSAGLGDIAGMLKGGDSIESIASGLGVDPSVYAEDKVDAVISDVSGGASDAAKDMGDKAAGEMDKATDALKGLGE